MVEGPDFMPPGIDRPEIVAAKGVAYRDSDGDWRCSLPGHELALVDDTGEGLLWCDERHWLSRPDSEHGVTHG
jgi:hypothetical protein